ncbi:hypothetical protein DSO57_1024921 [Entomophthora muscae]|uniref:Uncharacterized protein n=1 Tax=Entomophthora muscae TaxID=34485 RepID=A0ACC2SRF2_9FUNG|nr:hypothetical protein DSO57_1024921 [Entomophthora muscae]
MLDTNLQEMSKFIKSINDRFSPLIGKLQELSSQNAIDFATTTVATATRETGVQKAITLTTLEESVHQLWALQPTVMSKA